jgi:hypothetical protein
MHGFTVCTYHCATGSVLFIAFLFLVDGSYGNWTTSPCSATCGQGVKIQIRLCDNPPGKYGGNCSKQGPAQEIRTCKTNPCPSKIYLYIMVISNDNPILPK